MTRLLTGIITVTLAALLTLTGGLAALTTGPTAPCAATTTITHSAPPGAATSAPTHDNSRWDSEQLLNAATIITVGAHLAIPPRGQIIALATAIQESGLHNLPRGDRDSLGLFQQRPSAGWGTPAQILDPTHAATRFYTALLAVPDWQTIPVPIAAQPVQNSAYPSAYASHEAAATRLYAAITGTDPSTIARGMTCPQGGQLTSAALPAGFSLPTNTPPQVVTAITWAITQLGTPYSYGGDCTAPHSGDPRRQCDCSSLTQMAFAAAHVHLPRTAAEQSRTGAPIPLNQVAAGDLIFSAGADGSPTNPGHVALSLGGGYLLEAPHTGSTVRVARIQSTVVVSIRRVVTPASPTTRRSLVAGPAASSGQ